MFWGPKSAGIVVIKYFDDQPKLLVLFDAKSYDLPKGHVEQGEEYLEAAIRETYEESAVKNLTFPWGNVSFDTEKARFFIAVTEDEPYAQRNPASGMFEHLGCRWLTAREALAVLPRSLKPAISWSEQIISGWSFPELSS